MSIGLEVFMGCYVSKYASKLVFGIVATVWYGRNMKLRQLIMKLKIGKWFVAGVSIRVSMSGSCRVKVGVFD